MIFIATALTFTCLWIFVHLLRSWSKLIQFFPAALLASFLCVAVSSPSFWVAIANGYPRDSFYDLDAFGTAGVLAISTTLILLFAVLMYWKSSKLFVDHSSASTPTTARSVTLFLLDCLVGIGVFGLLHATSPQLYYSFYQILIPDLPNQIVIKTLFDGQGLLKFASLSASDSLSNHLSGLVLLMVIPLTVFIHTRASTSRFSTKMIIALAGSMLLIVNYL